ncbi:MAG TPA: glycosyltransferase [Nannocystaceae bacterium]|nr:glycosyltransferase [Nannocystaceae bacterium]
MANATELVPWMVALGGAASAAANGVTHICVRRKLRRARPALREAPAVSILKPLRGLDEGLYDNLRSIVHQDYPGPVQIVLGTTSADDPALAVALRLRAEHPDVDMAIVVGRPERARNPKVANLVGLAEAAKHELLLVSDSNVRVGTDYLTAVVGELGEPGVGLVANVIAVRDEQGIGAAFEALQLNGFVASAVCGADELVRHPCVIGKSMLLRRCELEALGGWRAFGDVLGEDYVIGRAYARAGHRVVISSYVVPTVGGRWTLARFASRHLRWCQMRRWIAPTAYAAEPILNPAPWWLGALWIASTRADALGVAASSWLGAAVVGVLSSVLRESSHARLLGARTLGIATLASVPLKDLAMLGIWMLGWVRRRVAWRGHAYVIGPGSRLEPIGPALELDAVPAATELR